MNPAWDQWKKSFDAWESATASYLEGVMRSPLVLEPAGALMTALFKQKALVDRAVAGVWSSVGLPTRRDQERELHALSQIQSRLIDLEDKLADLETRLAQTDPKGKKGARGPVERPS